MAQLPENIKKMEGTIFDIKSKISNQEYILLMNLLAQVYKDVEHRHQLHTEVCKVAKRVVPLQAQQRELVRRYKIEIEKKKSAERRVDELGEEVRRLRCNPMNKRLQNENKLLKNENEILRKKLELYKKQEKEVDEIINSEDWSDRLDKWACENNKK